jgi:hypothetical protein
VKTAPEVAIEVALEVVRGELPVPERVSPKVGRVKVTAVTPRSQRPVPGDPMPQMMATARGAPQTVDASGANMGAPEVTPAKVGAPEVTPAKVRAPEMAPAKVRAPEMAPAKVRAPEMAPAKMGAPEVGMTAEVTPAETAEVTPAAAMTAAKMAAPKMTASAMMRPRRRRCARKGQRRDESASQENDEACSTHDLYFLAKPAPLQSALAMSMRAAPVAAPST